MAWRVAAPGLPLRKHLARGFILGTVAAFLALSIALNFVQGGRLEHEAGGHTQEAVARVTTELDNYIDRNQAGLIALASVIEADGLGMAGEPNRASKSSMLFIPRFEPWQWSTCRGNLTAADPMHGATGQSVSRLESRRSRLR